MQTNLRGERVSLAALILFCTLWRLPGLDDLPWLNDEGTYATVGRAVVQGEALYRQIWENKPPAVYLLYGAVHLLNGPAHLLLGVRLLALLAAVLAQVAIYLLVERARDHPTALLAVAFSGLGFDLPLLDGTEANAEIFLAAASSAGMALLWRGATEKRSSQGIHLPSDTRADEHTRNSGPRAAVQSRAPVGGHQDAQGEARGGGAWVIRLAAVAAAGVAFGIAILFKLPAGADLLAALAVILALLPDPHRPAMHVPRPVPQRGAFAEPEIAARDHDQRPGPRAVEGGTLPSTGGRRPVPSPGAEMAGRLAPACMLLAGAILPLAMVAGWLTARGLLGDALYATVGYNRGYVTTGQGQHALILTLAGLLGLLLLALIGVWLARRRRDSGAPSFGAGACWWLALALLGALASGRSYPHYYLQAVPPLAVCLALIVHAVAHLQPRRRQDSARSRAPGASGPEVTRSRIRVRRALAALLILWTCGVPLLSWLALRHERPGDPPGSNPIAYYGHAWERLTGTLNETTYGNRLDPHVERNLAVIRYLTDHPVSPRRLYIWGNTPWIYYLARYEHAARFISAFYRPPIPGGMDQVLRSLRSDPPPYVVVMEPPSPPSPPLATLIQARYRLLLRIDNAAIYTLNAPRSR